LKRLPQLIAGKKNMFGGSDEMHSAVSAAEIAEDTNLTINLARFSSGLKYRDLPGSVILVTKQCILDGLGVTLAGSRNPLAAKLFSFVRSEGAIPQSTVLGFGDRLSPTQAALVNGSAAHALDYDDVLRPLHGHPTAAILPVVMALGEKKGIGGKGIITSFVAGVEVAARVGAMMGEKHYAKGWHATGTVGTFGAAAAAAHILKLDAEKTAQCFGIAATQAAGLKSMFGTECKPLHAGKAAMNGIIAAELASRDFSTRTDALECRLGFADTQTDSYQPDQALEGLGEFFHLLDVKFKYHASCFGTHAMLDALSVIKNNPAYDQEKVSRVELRVPISSLDVCNIQKPTSGLQSKFSYSFNAALSILNEETSSLQSYSDEMTQRADIIAMRDKVSVTSAKNLDRYAADVFVYLGEKTVITEHGDMGPPVEDYGTQGEKLEHKFRALAEPLVGHSNTTHVINSIWSLECQPGVGPALSGLAVA
jgi:2-methylcitrate dehydratase PrpD